MSNSRYRESYGCWAGDSRGSPPDHTRCCEEVRAGETWRYRQCSRPRGHGPEKAYCKQHDPEAVRRRQEDQRLAYIHEFESRRPNTHGPKFLQVLREIAAGHNDPRELAIRTLAEFDAGSRVPRKEE